MKLVDMNETTNIKLLEGHTRGVRCATWHPSGTLLVRFSRVLLSHMLKAMNAIIIDHL